MITARSMSVNTIAAQPRDQSMNAVWTTTSVTTWKTSHAPPRPISHRGTRRRSRERSNHGRMASASSSLKMSWPPRWNWRNDRAGSTTAQMSRGVTPAAAWRMDEVSAGIRLAENKVSRTPYLPAPPDHGSSGASLAATATTTF